MKYEAPPSLAFELEIKRSLAHVFNDAYKSGVHLEAARKLYLKQRRKREKRLLDGALSMYMAAHQAIPFAWEGKDD